MHRWLLLLSLLAGAGAAGQDINPELFQGLRWRSVGPHRGGRTVAAAGIPGQPNVFYMAQVNGGVWKSDDYGRMWNPIFDSQPTQSVGAMAIAPSDPNLIYVGSGEGLARPDLSIGDGIYRSTDAGKTWTHLGLREGQAIAGLAIDPRDGNHVFAAVLGHPYGANAERGIYESTDGGQSWKKSLYIDENTGGSEIAIDPSNPDVIYGGMWEVRQAPWEFGNDYAGTHGGLFKSTDSGRNWHKLTTGLPADVIQVHIAIAPSNTRRLILSVATEHDTGIYRSDDAGDHWNKVTTDARPANRIGGGDLAVQRFDPKDADIVYSTSIVTWRSTDGGKTWSALRGAPGGDDYQNMWINPINPDIILLVGDQGALVSANRGVTWSSWYNQPTAQLYHAIATNTFPYRVCAGQQESGSVCVSSRGNDGETTFREWHPVGVIEYGYVAPDPRDPDIIFGAGRGQVSKYHISTGQVQIVTPSETRDGKYRADRTAPIMFSEVDPHVLYYASDVLFKSTDAAQSWQIISPDLTRPHPGIPASIGSMAAKDPGADKQRGVIYSLAPSCKNTTTIWAGTDEGLIWVTRDSGRRWKDITPPDLTAWSKVTQLAASHFDDQTLYASISRFRIDDLHPLIYRTHDGGKTWKLITAGLPDSPIDTVREDPVRKGLLFAGSETAVWVSFDDGDHWQSLQLNLPHTAMRDLWIHGSDLIVATHGRGFWILDDIAPLRQINQQTAQSQIWLSKPSGAIRLRWNTNTDTPIPPDEPTAENPPDGVALDYYLGAAITGPATLEISDGSGKVVRRYRSTDKPEMSEDDLAKLAIPHYWPRINPLLSSEPGMHRFIWDLHYSAPDALRHDFPIAAVPHNTPRLPLGPRVVPGNYTVKLIAGGQTQTAAVTVNLDPRVKVTMAALQQEWQVETKLASMLTRSTEAILQARSAAEQIEKSSKSTTGETHEAVEAVEKKIKTLLAGGGFGPTPQAKPAPSLSRVNSFAAGLYGDVDSADAAPTAAQMAALPILTADYKNAMELWEKTKTTDLAALNKQLAAAGLAEIHIEANAVHQDDPEEGDLE